MSICFSVFARCCCYFFFVAFLLLLVCFLHAKWQKFTLMISIELLLPTIFIFLTKAWLYKCVYRWFLFIISELLRRGVNKNQRTAVKAYRINSYIKMNVTLARSAITTLIAKSKFTDANPTAMANNFIHSLLLLLFCSLSFISWKSYE